MKIVRLRIGFVFVTLAAFLFQLGFAIFPQDAQKDFAKLFVEKMRKDFSL